MKKQVIKKSTSLIKKKKFKPAIQTGEKDPKKKVLTAAGWTLKHL